MRPYKLIISGGGTGGHIYPAIAIANEFMRRYPDAQVLFVGANGRMEMDKVPNAGYKIKGLWISGIQRKLTLDNLAFPIKLLSSLFKARKIVKNHGADVVVGTGGFASGPLVRMGASLKVPALIQEQNGYAGITNKWLAKSVDKVCVAYDNMDQFFPKNKLVKTGNPVRSDLLSIDGKRSEAIQNFGLDSQKKTLLILGGSLGARAINELIAAKITFFENHNMQLLWQTGKNYFEQYKLHANTAVKIMPYIDQMDLAYAAADIIISRAGASSVSELCIVGKATVFIPSPNVAEDHQTKNARAIATQDAAIVLKESEALFNFETELSKLINDSARCEQMGSRLKAKALPNATQMIVDEIEKLIK